MFFSCFREMIDNVYDIIKISNKPLSTEQFVTNYFVRIDISRCYFTS